MNVSSDLIMQPSKGLYNQVVKIVVPKCTCVLCRFRLDRVNSSEDDSSFLFSCS